MGKFFYTLNKNVVYSLSLFNTKKPSQLSVKSNSSDLKSKHFKQKEGLHLHSIIQGEGHFNFYIGKYG